MPKLTWDTVGERFFELGVDKGVLYVGDSAGVAWNGIVSVEENPSGGDAKPYYVDGVKYLNLSQSEEFEATLNAFYSPEEFDVCDGMVEGRTGLYVTQQYRSTFGLTYRTRIGNDIDGANHSYKIHIIYNALANPTNHNFSAIDNSVDVPVLSWGLTSKPEFVPGVGYTSHLIVDSTKADAFALGLLEDILYGTEAEFPRLPTTEEMMLIFDTGGMALTVTDMGSDIFEIAGSSFAVHEVAEDVWEIEGDTVLELDPDTFEISSE